jgi:L-aspartate oxidase
MTAVNKNLMPTMATDVVVLGAGLAGMRAAWAVLETDSKLDVTVVSQRFGPSGSSFANINNKLGMQVCLTDREKEEFTKEAISIAAPGYIDPELVRILAEESEARFLELVAVGLPFDRNEPTGYLRATGCFSPGEARAYIFTGLAEAFSKLRDKFVSLGGRFLEGWLIQDLIPANRERPQRIYGAVLQKAVGEEKIAVRANSVIVALGGAAPLFVQNVGGPGTHGISHALLKRVGAKLVNTPYLQFLWHTVPSHHFWSIQACLVKGARIRSLEGTVLPVPKELFEFAEERSAHCPVGYGLEDSVVDRFFVENLNSNGEIDVSPPQSGWTTLALMAHAGNGGARIDGDGWTGIRGLYACGESAGGMHGANRIGGAMVTGTQVFGARAGKAAAVAAGVDGPLSEKSFRDLATDIVQTQAENEEERREVIPWLRCGMQEFAILGGRSGLKRFQDQIHSRLSGVRDWRSRLALEAAATITEEEILTFAPPVPTSHEYCNPLKNL